MSADNTEKLKDVFDLCDVENKGFITVEHFVSLAKDNFGVDAGGEQVRICEYMVLSDIENAKLFYILLLWSMGDEYIAVIKLMRVTPFCDASHLGHCAQMNL